MAYILAPGPIVSILIPDNFLILPIIVLCYVFPMRIISTFPRWGQNNGGYSYHDELKFVPFSCEKFLWCPGHQGGMIHSEMLQLYGQVRLN